MSALFAAILSESFSIAGREVDRVIGGDLFEYGVALDYKKTCMSVLGRNRGNTCTHFIETVIPPGFIA